MAHSPVTERTDSCHRSWSCVHVDTRCALSCSQDSSGPSSEPDLPTCVKTARADHTFLSMSHSDSYTSNVIQRKRTLLSCGSTISSGNTSSTRLAAVVCRDGRADCVACSAHSITRTECTRNFNFSAERRVGRNVAEEAQFCQSAGAFLWRSSVCLLKANTC